MLRAPTEVALARRFEKAVAAQSGSSDPHSYAEAVDIARTARAFGFRIDTPNALATIERLMLDTARLAVAERSDDAIDTALRIVRLAHDLELTPNVERVQEVVYDALLRTPDPRLEELGDAVGLAVERLGQPSL